MLKLSAGSWALTVPFRLFLTLTSGQGLARSGWMTSVVVATRQILHNVIFQDGERTTVYTGKMRESVAMVRRSGCGCSLVNVKVTYTCTVVVRY